jgi:hypothetical protein
LNLAEAPVGPRQEQAAEQRGCERGDLRGDAVRVEPEAARGNHAEPRHLRHRQIDVDDAAAQDLSTERHVRREH